MNGEPPAPPLAWTVLELPGLIPIGHVTGAPARDGGRTESWAVAPHHLPWFTSAEATTTAITPRGVQLRHTDEPPPLAPAGTWLATQAVTEQPARQAPPAPPRVFRLVAYDLYDGESFSSLALPVRGRVFRSAIGPSVQEWWFVQDGYELPSGTRVTELRPVRLPQEPQPRRGKLEQLWQQARARASTYSYRSYSLTQTS